MLQQIWVTIGIAERLTRRTEREIMAAVNEPANGIKSKESIIGQRSYFLIDRAALLEHFAESAGPRPAA
jgi:hypothetical protein